MFEANYHANGSDKSETIDWVGSSGFMLIHLACLLVFWVEVSWAAVAICLVCYLVRMFGITAGYHRYFSHRAYKTSRPFQFLLACLGAAAAQKGPLWWASHHRHHHQHSDTTRDVHSPVVRGLWWSHVGWILCRKYNATNLKLVKDWTRYPELRWLDRYFLLPPLMLALALLALGVLLERYAPGIHTSGAQMVIYGFIVSTVLLYHGTFTVNSLAHRFGRRRFPVSDDSRNNFWIALITLGEGYHNNHHYYPAAARQGFYWWELDLAHALLKLLAWARLVWDLKLPPARIYRRTASTKELVSPN